MDCQALEQLLSQGTLAELTAEQRRAVAAHVEACEACRSKWGFDQQSQVFHAQAEALRPARDVTDAVMARLAEEPQNAGADGGANGQPRRLAGFELLGRLGKGGMGTVLQARHIALNRPVALKILPKRLAQNRDFVARFIREARSAAQLDHPHIVRAYDVGKAEGYYYFAMELVEGEGLDAILRREGPLEQNRALGYMKQVASALAAAHAKGIVHRDIKPSNIMIDREGAVRVTDFGLARRTEGDIAVTADGATLGTPAYVSPEMAKGGEAEPRSDLYSLGATLFHLLAGRPPFEGRSFSEVLIKQATEPPPSLADLAPRVDRRLCRVVHRLLAKSPDGRYSSAEALLGTLEALGKLKPHVQPAPRPRPVGAARHARRQRRRRRLTAAIAVAGAAAALVVAVVAFALTRSGPGRGEFRGTMVEERARAAFQAAAAHLEEHPADLEGSLERLRAVQASFPGTEWASRAEAKVREIEHRQQQLAAEAAAWKRFEQELAASWGRCEALMAKDQFGKALEQIDALKRGYPGEREASALRTLSLDVHGEAEKRYAALARDADAALAAKDYAKARAAIRPGLAFGIEDFAQMARKKLDEIDEREEKAEHWAKWDAIKAKSDQLAEAGQWDEALKALGAAEGLPLNRRAELIAEQTRAVEAFRQKAIDAAVAAYGEQSEEVWDRLKERQYGEAERLVAAAKANAAYALAAGRVAADAEAAKLLGEFWAVVEAKVRERIGGQIAIADAIGTLESVRDGVATIVVRGVPVERDIRQMTPDQATGIAQLGNSPRGKLLLGVFLLAEGAKLAEAGEALAAAGDAPAVAIFRERLAALTQQAVPITPDEQRVGAWQALFDGKTLDGWRVLPGVDPRHVGTGQGVIGFYEHGRVGIAWTREFPTDHYEVVVEAQAVKGEGRFCEMAFPVGDSYCSLLVGGGLVGLDAVDGRSGENNVTTKRGKFRIGQWYLIRVRSAADSVRVWIDREEIINLPRAGTRLTLSPGFQARRPFALASDRTRAAIRRVLLRRLAPSPSAEVTVSVPGRASWVDSGRDLAAGRRYELTASGAWIHARGSRVGPEGKADEPASQEFPLPGAPCFSLIGRLGQDGKPFAVGRHLVFVPRQSGRLYMQINDWRLHNNSWDVRVTIRELAVEGKWQSLFDGKTLGDWKPIQEPGAYARPGNVAVEDGAIVMDPGKPLTGVLWTGEFPEGSYELTYETAKRAGPYQFGCVVFPVGQSSCSLTLGAGAHHNIVGLSSVDGKWAGGNLTRKHIGFQHGLWYRVRLRVTEERIAIWLDETPIVDLPTEGHAFTADDQPKGLRSIAFNGYQNTCAVRDIRVRGLAPSPPLARETTVRAEVGWQEAGCRLLAGHRYELTAKGTWSPLKPHWFDANGGDTVAVGNWPLRGARNAALIGRIGADGRPFLVGNRLVFAPVSSGQLYLVMNDDMNGNWRCYGDNSGELRVTVRELPAEGPEELRRLAAEQPRVSGVAVAAKEGWQDSGRRLFPGCRYELTATGTWSAGPGLPCGPEGVGGAAGGECPLPGAPGYALIGRVGADGEPFLVGKGLVLGPEASGQLYLIMNDGAYGDNSGELRVTIRVVPAEGR